MPALDLDLISQVGRDLHPAHTPGLMAEDEVCPWTLFLTMALTLLKGVMPHVPKVLPMVISDPDTRQRAVETFESQEFKDNIEQYFVENIKTDIQAPLNRQIIKSSETVMFGVDLLNNVVSTFLGGDNGNAGQVLAGLVGAATANVGNGAQFAGDQNDLGTTDQQPRSASSGGLGSYINPQTLAKVAEFARTMYNLS